MKIELLVDQVNDDRITLKTTDDQVIYWPASKLPAGIKEGSTILFSIDNKDSQEEANVAKEILNEILGT